MRDAQKGVALRDTSPKADEVYWQRLSRMTPSERLAIGVDLWKAGDALQRSALRSRNPNASEEEITFRLAVIRFGLELARKVYGRS